MKIQRSPILLILLILGSACVQSQTVSKKFIQEYSNLKNGADKGNYIFRHIPDSTASLSNFQILLTYFLEQEDEIGTDYTKLLINLSQNSTGEFTNSLRESFEILSRFEKRKDKFGEMASLSAIGNAFDAAKRYDTAIAYQKRVLRLAWDLNDTVRYLNAMNDLAYTYYEANKPDSGLVYSKEMVDLCYRYKYKWFLAYALSTLGENYIAKGDFISALPVLQESLLHITYDSSALTVIFNDMAECYTALEKKDSLLYFTDLAIVIAKKNDYKNQLVRSYTNLYKFFDKVNRIDSSNKYFRLAAVINDSIYNLDKLTIVQETVFRDQLKKQEEFQKQRAQRERFKLYSLLIMLAVFLIIATVLYRTNKQKQKVNILLAQQKKTVELTLDELKSTQAQLIQSEKMASLGQLTAGIAHEIQNPLNFVNNFSDVNTELIEELKTEALGGNINEVVAIANDIQANEEKINHHGKRADAIVKGMLQHSRTSTGIKEPTDINALADEYLRLSYQGLRAKDKSFNATIQTDFDTSIGKINIIPQDIGRVLLNLYNNAFYATNEKLNAESITKHTDYKPTVSVQTKKINDTVEIIVKDNGNGIPQSIVDKIFQPFFTTKPTGQGTGLGLSLAYDIVKAHGGEINVETKEEEGSIFIIQLPNK